MKETLARYQWLLFMAAWIALMLAAGLLRFSPYGIDENGARALLINWTIAERIANPILTLGAPDFRSLVFLPLGAYWPGSMIAVKVFTAILMFLAVAILFAWNKARISGDAAIIIGALLLINPAVIHEINALGAAPFILLLFGIGAWTDARYRAANKQLAGLYFLHVFVTLTAVSIHPLGLAYPIGLAWHWWREPVDRRQQKQIFVGLAIASIIILLLRMGWPQLEWFENPFKSLGMLLVADVPDAPMPISAWWGAVPALALAATLFFRWREISTTLWGRMLVAAIALGVVAADATWAVCGLTLMLSFGLGAIIRNLSAGNTALRGVAFALMFFVATFSMIADKNYRVAYARDAKTPIDGAIHMLASDLANSEQAIQIGSQWPGRTMLATRHASFPLPPAERGDQLANDASAMDFLVFNPYTPQNKALADAIADAGGDFETVTVDDGVVLIRTRKEGHLPDAKDETAEPATHDESAKDTIETDK